MIPKVTNKCTQKAYQTNRKVCHHNHKTFLSRKTKTPFNSCTKNVAMCLSTDKRWAVTCLASTLASRKRLTARFNGAKSVNLNANFCSMPRLSTRRCTALISRSTELRSAASERRCGSSTSKPASLKSDTSSFREKEFFLVKLETQS